MHISGGAPGRRTEIGANSVRNRVCGKIKQFFLGTRMRDCTALRQDSELKNRRSAIPHATFRQGNNIIVHHVLIANGERLNEGNEEATGRGLNGRLGW